LLYAKRPWLWQPPRSWLHGGAGEVIMGVALGNAELRTAGARIQVYTYRYDTPSSQTRRPALDLLALVSNQARGAAGVYRSAYATSPLLPLGGMMIVPAGTSISAVGPGGERQFAVCTRADGLLPPDFDASDPRQLALCSDIREANVWRTMERLAAEAKAPGFAADLLVDGLSTALAVDLARYFRGAAAGRAVNRSGVLAPWQLRRVQDHVASAEGKRLRIADLAAAAEVSPGHLTRTFKKTTGRTVHQFVAEARLARARLLLRETQLPLKQIAAQLGFGTPSSFSLAFRRATGTTPAQYRDQA